LEDIHQSIMIESFESGSSETSKRSLSLSTAGSLELSENVEVASVSDHYLPFSDEEKLEEYRRIKATAMPRSIKEALLKKALAHSSHSSLEKALIPRTVQEDIQRKKMKKRQREPSKTAKGAKLMSVSPYKELSFSPPLPSNIHSNVCAPRRFFSTPQAGPRDLTKNLGG
jgi:hypothetical protein